MNDPHLCEKPGPSDVAVGHPSPERSGHGGGGAGVDIVSVENRDWDRVASGRMGQGLRYAMFTGGGLSRSHGVEGSSSSCSVYYQFSNLEQFGARGRRLRYRLQSGDTRVETNDVQMFWFEAISNGAGAVM